MKEKTTEAEKTVLKALDGEMVELKVQLYGPFVDFLKEYLSFFGAKKTVVDVCREMIYEQAEFLCSELREFADDGHFLSDADFSSKFPHMSLVSVKDEEPEVTES